MRTLVLAATLLGLSAAGAMACPYSNSAKASDKMTVASIETPAKQQSMASQSVNAPQPKQAEGSSDASKE